MANIAGIMELYTAYFNRAADKDGVDYWANEMDTKGWTLDDVANSFAQQTEYTALYAGKTNAEIVALVYTNVLNRDADTDGAAYWEAELDSGAVTVSQLIQAVVNAATKKDATGAYVHATDAAIVDNKTAVSQHAYDSNVNAKDISLAGVTADVASIEAAKAAVDAAKAADGDTGMLTESLATLEAANTAKAEFLEAVELEYTVGTNPKVTVKAKTADEKSVTDYYTATTTELALKTDLAGFDDKSASLQDAAIAEKKASLEKTVANEKKDTASNMTSLLEDVTAKEKAVVAKNKELIEATTAAEAEAAKLVVIDSTMKAGATALSTGNQPTTANALKATVNSTIDVEIAKVNANSGLLELVSYDAATMTGFTAAQLTAVQAKAADYIAAFNANVAADKAVDAAVTALETAAEAVVLADTKAYSIADQGTLITTTSSKGNASFTVEANFAAGDVKVYAKEADQKAAEKTSAPVAVETVKGVADTTSEVQTITFAAAQAAGTIKVGTVNVAIAKGDTDAQVAAKVVAAFNPGGTVLSDYSTVEATGAAVAFTFASKADEDLIVVTDDSNVFAPTTAGVTASSVDAVLTDVTELQTAIKNLETFKQLIVDFEASRDLYTELEALNKAVTDATEAITNPVEPEDADVTPGLGLKLTTITTDGSTTTASSKDDIFLMNLDENADDFTISGFGTEGLDKLFVGTDYTFVEIGKDEKITDSLGDVSKLEIFYKQVGTNVTLYIEDETFAGNGSTIADMVTVTLTGVSTDVEFTNGFIQAGEIA